MTEKKVLIEKKGRIAYVILNRANKLNAFDRDMLLQFDEALDQLKNDKSIFVVIVKGEGKAFSVGYDVSPENPDRQTESVMEDRDVLEDYMKRWLRVWEYPKPVIAQVDGYALAGGTQLCAACDMVITSEEAKFGFPTIPLGGGFVGPMWSWHVGYQRAKMMDYIAGSSIDGKKAKEWGLAAEAFPANRLEEETLEIARKIAKTPLDILTMKKKSFNRIMEMQGFRTATLFGPEQDAIVHSSEGVNLSVQKIGELGLKGAIEWFNNQTV